jgi:hypothetical protein
MLEGRLQICLRRLRYRPAALRARPRHLLDRPLATFEPFLRDRPDDDRYLRALVALLRVRVEAAAGGFDPWSQRRVD